MTGPDDTRPLPPSLCPGNPRIASSPVTQTFSPSAPLHPHPTPPLQLSSSQPWLMRWPSPRTSRAPLPSQAPVTRAQSLPSDVCQSVPSQPCPSSSGLGLVLFLSTALKVSLWTTGNSQHLQDTNSSLFLEVLCRHQLTFYLLPQQYPHPLATRSSVCDPQGTFRYPPPGPAAFFFFFLALVCMV